MSARMTGSLRKAAVVVFASLVWLSRDAGMNRPPARVPTA
jgi:hypothetical protein